MFNKIISRLICIQIFVLGTVWGIEKPDAEMFWSMKRSWWAEGLLFDRRTESGSIYCYCHEHLLDKGGWVDWCREYELAETLGELYYKVPGFPMEESLWDEPCYLCRRESKPILYSGYFSFFFAKYFFLFRDYLYYVSENEECECYWPERSVKAVKINDRAAELLFSVCKKYLKKNHFSKVSDLRSEQIFEEYFCNIYTKYCKYSGSTQGLQAILKKINSSIFFETPIVPMVCHSFFFSDYEWVLQDLTYFFSIHLDEDEFFYVQTEIRKIKEEIGWLYYDLYKECLSLHPNEKIEAEFELLESFLGIPPLMCNLSLDKNYQSRCSAKSCCQAKHQSSEREKYPPFFQISNRPDNWVKAELLVRKGTCCNDLFLYSEALSLLNEAITICPEYKVAFQERAAAHFELGNFDAAVTDYFQGKTPHVPECFVDFDPPNVAVKAALPITGMPLSSHDFAAGIVVGVTVGSKDGLEDFVPCMLSSCRGLVHGLWAFCCSPVEVSKELVVVAHEVGNWVSSHYPIEWLEVAVPEIRDLRASWVELSQYQRGEKLGYIIGKYGVDVFVTAGVVKGLSSFRALKRANTMMTLEASAQSGTKKAQIISKSDSYLHRWQKGAESAKNGAIIAKNPNVQYHVMQKKHAWDRVVKLTGNVEKDFKEVVQFLERNQMYDKSHLFEGPNPFPRHSPKIHRSDYRIQVGEHQIMAVFEEYIETGEAYLKDAWVVN